MAKHVVPGNTYRVLLKLTNSGTTTQTIYVHAGDVFNVSVIDLKGTQVYSWLAATGRGSVSGSPFQSRLGPGESVVEARWFKVPRPGRYRVEVTFTIPGMNPERLADMLRVTVEAR